MDGWSASNCLPALALCTSSFIKAMASALARGATQSGYGSRSKSLLCMLRVWLMTFFKMRVHKSVSVQPMTKNSSSCHPGLQERTRRPAVKNITRRQPSRVQTRRNETPRNPFPPEIGLAADPMQIPFPGLLKRVDILSVVTPENNPPWFSIDHRRRGLVIETIVFVRNPYCERYFALLPMNNTPHVAALFAFSNSLRACLVLLAPSPLPA